MSRCILSHSVEPSPISIVIGAPQIADSWKMERMKRPCSWLGRWGDLSPQNQLYNSRHTYTVWAVSTVLSSAGFCHTLSGRTVECFIHSAIIIIISDRLFTLCLRAVCSRALLSRTGNVCESALEHSNRRPQTQKPTKLFQRR